MSTEVLFGILTPEAHMFFVIFWCSVA